MCQFENFVVIIQAQARYQLPDDATRRCTVDPGIRRFRSIIGRTELGKLFLIRVYSVKPPREFCCTGINIAGYALV